MKKPRVEDFDPNTTPTLSSPLDGMPAIQTPLNQIQTPKTEAAQASVVPLKTPLDEQVLRTPPSPIASPLVSPTIEVPVQTPARPSVRPFGSLPGRRTITRYAFEFFQDQIETLKGFSLEQKLRGEKGSMSEMIREATDAYIAQRRRAEET